MTETNFSNSSLDTRKRFESLVMGAVDGELTREEGAEFERLIREHPEFRVEFKQFIRIKEVTKSMPMKLPPEEVWDTYWYRVYNRMERRAGWILLSIGAIVLITYGLYQFVMNLLADRHLETFIKIAIIAVLAGAVIVIISVLREKAFVRRTDPYKEIKR
ncbi:hypothetical protein JXB12_03950 [candidate division KSB1 bacterium]|nr:hypothetical protein [candidate division KSB1 bacterium]